MGRLSYEILEEIISNGSEGLLVLDAAGPEITVVLANRAYELECGYSATELEGSPWLQGIAADDDSSEIVELRRRLLCDEIVEITLPLLRRDGAIRLARLRFSPLRAAGTGSRLVLVQRLRAEPARAESAELLKRALGSARRKIANLDRIDQVTGLMSRTQFELLLRRELAISRREGRLLCLMLFDVPELDIYRQTFGDNAADSCLRMVGAQIAGTFRRASDLCARYDHSMIAVAVLGQDGAQARELVALVERKANSLGLHNPRGRQKRYIFVRGGHTLANPDGEDIETLLARARAAFDNAPGDAVSVAVAGA